MAAVPPPLNCPFDRRPFGTKCVKIVQLIADGEVETLGIKIVVLIASCGFLLAYFNRINYFIARWRYVPSSVMGGHLLTLRVWSCLISLIAFSASFIARIYDWTSINLAGVTAFTVLVMINMGASLVASAFLCLEYVNNLLVLDGDLRRHSGYQMVTKIICCVYIVVAVFQAAFYAGVTIKYRGARDEWVLATQYVQIACNLLGIVMAGLMFGVGAKIVNHTVHKIRHRAANCVTWGCFTMVCSLFNVFVIALYHMKPSSISGHLSVYLQLFIQLQERLTPYLNANLLLFLCTIAQHVANLIILLGKDSDEIYPMESTWRWIKHIIGISPYKFPYLTAIISEEEEGGGGGMTMVTTGGKTSRSKSSDATRGLVSVVYDEDYAAEISTGAPDKDDQTTEVKDVSGKPPRSAGASVSEVSPLSRPPPGQHKTDFSVTKGHKSVVTLATHYDVSSSSSSSSSSS